VNAAFAQRDSHCVVALILVEIAAAVVAVINRVAAIARQLVVV